MINPNKTLKEREKKNKHLKQRQGCFTTSGLHVLQKVRLILQRTTKSNVFIVKSNSKIDQIITDQLTDVKKDLGTKIWATQFNLTTDHDENIEGVSWLLLVHPAQEVVADDVDQTRAQIVFGLHHHVDAVRTQGGEPASEGLQAEILMSEMQSETKLLRITVKFSGGTFPPTTGNKFNCVTDSWSECY